MVRVIVFNHRSLDNYDIIISLPLNTKLIKDLTNDWIIKDKKLIPNMKLDLENTIQIYTD